MPGEHSGELKLLSPGQEPETVAAAPQDVPLPDASAQETELQKASPFAAPEETGWADQGRPMASDFLVACCLCSISISIGSVYQTS